jgi:metallo-beta-lactamase class B
MPSYPNVGKDYRYTFEQLKGLQFDLWVASHASQFSLHDKRKTGDPYRPEAFADQEGFKATLQSVQGEYNKRQKEK